MNFKEPLLIKVLLFFMILEIPFFNLFLIIPVLMTVFLIFFFKKKLRINIQMFILLIFISLYFIFDTQLEHSAEYKVWYILSTLFVYVAGYCSCSELLIKKECFLKVRYNIELIAKSYLCYVIISLIYGLLKGQFTISRNPLNIWSGELRAATHYGTMLVIPVVYGLFLLFVEKERKKHFLGSTIIIFSILFSIITASRTILYLTIIGYIYVYCQSHSIDSFGSHIKQLLWIGVAMIVFIISYHFDIFNFRTLLLNSQLGQRYLNGKIDKFSNDGRTINVIFLLSHLKESLYGGGYTRIHSGNLHNIYLNVYDLSGIIPFVFLIIFTLGVIKSVRKLFKRKYLSKKDQILVSTFYFLTFIQLLLEPVMESVPVFCWCLLYISGMIEKSSLYRRKLR